MDARHLPAAALAALCLLVSESASAAPVRTPNFVVEAPTDAIAEQIGKAAEQYRHDLAVHWLGEPLPKNWRKPCPIRVRVGEQLGAGGETSFLFDRGHVFGWEMEIQGSLERVLDSVLPHEITHTIFASYFRQPLPRWADEGACTTVEHEVERGNHRRMLVEFLHTSRGIAFSQMFAMTEYPRDVLPLYSQGHSLVTYLLQQGGPRKFVAFMENGLEADRWTEAVREHYGHPSLAALQDSWLDWVKEGSPETEQVAPLGEEQLAADGGEAIIYRGQNPEDDGSLQRTAPRPGPVEGNDRESVYEPARQARGGAIAFRPGPENDPGRAAGPSEEPSEESDAAEGDEDSGSAANRVILEWRRPQRENADEPQELPRRQPVGGEPLRDASQPNGTRRR